MLECSPQNGLYVGHILYDIFKRYSLWRPRIQKRKLVHVFPCFHKFSSTVCQCSWALVISCLFPKQLSKWDVIKCSTHVITGPVLVCKHWDIFLITKDLNLQMINPPLHTLYGTLLPDRWNRLAFNRVKVRSCCTTTPCRKWLTDFTTIVLTSLFCCSPTGLSTGLL